MIDLTTVDSSLIDKVVNDDLNEQLFSNIASDLSSKGYSINVAALPPQLTESLLQHLAVMDEQKFDPAGIGRKQDQMLNNFVRRDEICWINGESQAGQAWLSWSAQLQTYLNRRLFLGLFSFESHFSHYGVGDFYKRHLDAFKGQNNRVLSLVVYLNPSWTLDDGGELVLYTDEHDRTGVKVTPALGTVAVFLSEEFPHEVLPAMRDRYSIAGWFRVNCSTADKVDPPR